MEKDLQNARMCDTLAVEDGWVNCRRCGKKHLKRILPTTQGKDISIYCPKCKTETIVNISNMSLSPRA